MGVLLFIVTKYHSIENLDFWYCAVLWIVRDELNWSKRNLPQAKSLRDYNSDYFAWTQEQAKLLKEGKLESIDLENLAEEIESLGKSDRRKLKSLFLRLLEHLLSIL